MFVRSFHAEFQREQITEKQLNQNTGGKFPYKKETNQAATFTKRSENSSSISYLLDWPECNACFPPCSRARLTTITIKAKPLLTTQNSAAETIAELDCEVNHHRKLTIVCGKMEEDDEFQWNTVKVFADDCVEAFDAD